MESPAQIMFDFDAREDTLDLLSADEKMILKLIRKGRENARQVIEIAELTGIDTRSVRAIVKDLIEKHGHCIGSSVGVPAGYYIITEQKEIDDVYDSLRHRGLSTLFRAARLKKLSVQAVFDQVMAEMATTQN